MKVLTSSCQWKELVIEKDDTGYPEIHYTNVYRTHKRWVNDGNLDRAQIGSIQLLDKYNLLDVG